jgi:hypothetical protein
VNEKTGTIADLWDGNELKCTFRRTVDNRMGRVWLEIVQLASTIVFSDHEDEMIWKFSSNGVYTSQSLYKVIYFGWINPVHVPRTWSIHIPLRLYFLFGFFLKIKS